MQAPANLNDERARARWSQCRRRASSARARVLAVYGIGNGATVRGRIPTNPPEGASEADCIVIIGTA